MSRQQETRKKRAAGATKTTSMEVKGKIVEFAWWLRKNGYRESTIKARTASLRRLIRLGADLYDPENVKEIIADQKWAENTKWLACQVYDCFLRMLGLTWDIPIYSNGSKDPFIPTEAEIDQLIAGCGKKISTMLRLIKETAVRVGEAKAIKWIDFDSTQKIIRVTPEKKGNPRTFYISAQLAAMINALPKMSERVFGDTPLRTDFTNFALQRKKVAKKLSNPRILHIRFHTLRHWKATTLYHQTKDPIYVQQFLGHKNLTQFSTLRYIHIAKAIYGQGNNDEFICKVAITPEDVSELIEAGFEYVTELEDKRFFRKRK